MDEDDEVGVAGERVEGADWRRMRWMAIVVFRGDNEVLW